MATITFTCVNCGENETLSDPLIVRTSNTEGWLCSRCIFDEPVCGTCGDKGVTDAMYCECPLPHFGKCPCPECSG